MGASASTIHHDNVHDRHLASLKVRSLLRDLDLDVHANVDPKMFVHKNEEDDVTINGEDLSEMIGLQGNIQRAILLNGRKRQVKHLEVTKTPNCTPTAVGGGCVVGR